MSLKNFKTRNGFDVDTYTLPNKVIEAKLTTNSATVIDTVALDSFISCEYFITFTQGSKIRSSKFIMQTNGTSLDATEFAITETGGSISGISLVAQVSSTNAVVKATATDANSTAVLIKMSRNINTPRVPTVPDAPTIGTATGITGGATVAFTAPVDNGGSEITSYTVISTPDGITVDGTSSPITVLGLTDSTNYTFKVRANNSIGYGDMSSSSNSVQSITPPTFSGGTVTSDSTYYYRTFKSSQTLTLNGAPVTVDYLMVGGGGGSQGGGGGAGGLINTYSETLATGSYPILVGAGGAQNGGANGGALSGNNTTFNSLTAFGGGYGAYYENAGNGGSGGGAGYGSYGTGVAGQGYNGGNYWYGATGGGGGAAGAGGNASGLYPVLGGNGGNGIQLSEWASATSTGANNGYYAGGGGGSCFYPYTNGTGGSGGLGGGGVGESDSNKKYVAAVANTGGGGASNTTYGCGPGGSGIFIIRYLKTAVGG